MIIEYKGFYIEHNFYGNDEWSLQFCGDDIIFETKQEAIDFVDSL